MHTSVVLKLESLIESTEIYLELLFYFCDVWAGKKFRIIVKAIDLDVTYICIYSCYLQFPADTAHKWLQGSVRGKLWHLHCVIMVYIKDAKKKYKLLQRSKKWCLFCVE